MNSQSDRYWLLGWLDDNGVTNVDQARRLLLAPSGLDGIREAALTANHGPPSRGSFSILAGKGVDLTGILDCPTPQCRHRQVDALFRRAWFYFDRITVSDGALHVLTCPAHRPTELISHIDVALYLRDMGAEELVDFQPLPPFPDPLAWRSMAVDYGFAQLIPAAEAMASRAFRTGTIDKRGRDFVFRCPEVHRMPLGLSAKDGARRFTPALRQEISERFVGRLVALLLEDLHRSRDIGLPLGIALPAHAEILAQTGGSAATPGAVAFELALPVLDAIGTPDLIRVRNEESEHFARFRLSLRKAISERLRLSPNSDSQVMAREIEMEIIEPELEQIRSRLNSAERVLGRSSLATVALGTLLTTCGVLTGSVPAAILGLGTVAEGLALPAQQYFKQRGDVELQDMYFLWAATQHGPKHKQKRATSGYE